MIIVCLLTLLVFSYLIYALVYPEKF
ncbi:potassium-transporting ATPase subunit F [Heyndrickxia sporothermodurans]